MKIKSEGKITAKRFLDTGKTNITINAVGSKKNKRNDSWNLLVFATLPTEITDKLSIGTNITITIENEKTNKTSSG